MTAANLPAFPVSAELCQDLTVAEQRGMTLRDYFAAKAMVGLMSMEHASEYVDNEDISNYDEAGTLFAHTDFLAEEAYMIADMMLKARKK